MSHAENPNPTAKKDDPSRGGEEKLTPGQQQNPDRRQDVTSPSGSDKSRGHKPSGEESEDENRDSE